MFERFIYTRNLRKLNKDLNKLIKTKNKEDVYKISKRLERRVGKCVSLIEKVYPFDDGKIKFMKDNLKIFTQLSPLIIDLKDGKITEEYYESEVKKLF